MDSVDWLLRNGYSVNFNSRWESGMGTKDRYVYCEISKCISSKKENGATIDEIEKYNYRDIEWYVGDGLKGVITQIDKLVSSLKAEK